MKIPSVVMAGVQCATTSTTISAHLCRRRCFSSVNLNSRKPIFVIFSDASPIFPKPTRRKNYLRPKILKILKKPFIPEPLSTESIIPIDFLSGQEVNEPEEAQFREFDKSENQELTEFEETEIQEATKDEVSWSSEVIVDGNVGKFHKNVVLKYGLWLVGAFVFHTVCAAWIFGSADLDSKDEILRENSKDEFWGLDKNGKNKSNLKFIMNGNGVSSVVYVDEMEMERKIEEIRTMAREAREHEKVELKNSGPDSDEDENVGDGKSIKTAIEKEVNNRLIKLQKKLEKAQKKSPVASVDILKSADERKNGVQKGRLGEKEGNGALMFEKKYKFKGLTNDLGEKPKGFTSSYNGDLDKLKRERNSEKGDQLLRSGDNDDKGDLEGGEQHVNLINGDLNGSGLLHLEDDDEKKGTLEVTGSSSSVAKKLVKEKGMRSRGKKGVSKVKRKIDTVQDRNQESCKIEAAKSGKSETESTKLRESAASNKLLNGENILMEKEAGKAQPANNVEDNKSETDFWWLNLPYVLAVLMRSGHDGGQHGFYTLKSTSSADGDLSYAVAFEDPGDARNFCYLLQSFFEDLKDFDVEIVPLKVNDLKEAVKTDNMRVVVVKKGQLQLYAGQPLADVETVLRALVELG